MGPLPKKRCARARQGDRRSHLARTNPPITDCPQCHSPKLNHHACPVCGYYADREAVTIPTPKKKAS